jgi:hypothetical protein
MSTLTQLAEVASKYKEQYDSGDLSSEEFKELVEDLSILKNIDSVASELETDVIARQVLLAVIAVAQAVA